MALATLPITRLAVTLPVTVIADVAVPAEVAYVALATQPVTLAPVKFVKAAPLPVNSEL